MNTKQHLTIIGGGLAGCEAAYQAAERGIFVHLYEMRPFVSTNAHTTSDLAELICSNSLGSKLPYKASGLLKEELRRLNSLLIKCAEKTSVPAGSALAVDRKAFSSLVTEIISNHPRIKVIRKEVTSIPETLTIIASGPLSSPKLCDAITEITGKDNLFFYDAIAPIVRADTIDMTKAFPASRYGKGESEEGDYINCPLSKEEYECFYNELINAQRIELKEFESTIVEGVTAGRKFFFEGCLPVEILARRGKEALVFGPMRPTGFRATPFGKRPYAVVQLRRDNLAGSLYNMVGFQTNLLYTEQKRVFRLIPGLERAEFERYGQMHRNTFIFSPDLLHPTMQFRKRENLFFAGQITGIEGYAGNIASGLVAGINAVRYLRDEELLEFPLETMIGALCHYVTHASEKDFQPMKANFGLIIGILEKTSSRKTHPDRKEIADLSLRCLEMFILQKQVL